MALLRVPPCWGHGGPFHRLGYMDDITWCIESEPKLLVFADNLQKARVLPNLFLSGPKQLLVVAAYDGFQSTFHPRSVYMVGSRMPVHQGPGYWRVLGRHLFPHIYHKITKMKLFRASRRASQALAMVCSQWTTSLAGGGTPANIQLYASRGPNSSLCLANGHWLAHSPFSPNLSISCLRVGGCQSSGCGGYQLGSTILSQTLVTCQRHGPP